MSSLSQALRLGDMPSPHSAFQEHAAHSIEWSMALSSKGSSGTCIPEVLRHSSILLSRRSASLRYATHQDNLEEFLRRRLQIRQHPELLERLERHVLRFID